MSVHIDDFEYDTYTNAIVIAKDEKQAIEFARTKNSIAKWVVEKAIPINEAEPQLITSFVHPG